MHDSEDSKNENIPQIQKLFDRPFLWLALGFVVMAIFYTLWGIYEIYSMPAATLP